MLSRKNDTLFWKLILFYLTFVSCLVSGKDVNFDHLLIEDGLSQGTVLAACQDQSGFIWVGTEDGLNKYDGYQFTVFKNDPENPKSISLN